MSFLNSLRPPASYQSGESEEQVEAESIRDHWKCETLESRKRVREELGDPQPRKYCFGCVYELSTEGVQISSADFKELCLVAAKCVGQMSLEAYGKELERLYKGFREKTNRKERHEHRVPLPEWKASSIVEHLCHHNVDPEIQTWIRLIEIQEMILVCMDSIVETNVAGQKRINKDSAATYEKLVKLWYHVASRPLDKQFGYRKNARMDIESVNQPFITTNQKSIIDYYTSSQGPHLVRQ